MIQNSSAKGTIMNHMSKNSTGLGLEVLGGKKKRTASFLFSGVISKDPVLQSQAASLAWVLGSFF